MDPHAPNPLDPGSRPIAQDRCGTSGVPDPVADKNGVRVEPEAGHDLSDRETEVLRLIALGYTNKEIAARMAISVKTVETYKARALEKLGFRTRVEVVRYAARRGWFDGL